jgi:hypothetical protein
MVILLSCWRCGESIEGYTKPYSRTAQCSACHADLHVCVQCRLYNATVSDHCDEPLARGQVRETDRANFCDYFEPAPNAYRAKSGAAAEQARSELAAMFGDESVSESGPGDAEAARKELDKLFGK